VQFTTHAVSRPSAAHRPDPGPLIPAPLRRPVPPPPQPLPPALAGVSPHAPDRVSDAVLDRLLDERIVFLGTEVDDAVANRITAQLLLLSAQDPHRDITLYVNSPGGSVTAGMAIYDTMRLVTPDIATWAIGFAASMGQFLVSAGTPGKRYALPHARILMHQPSAGVGGTASDIAIQADLFNKWKQELARITAEQTGQTTEQIIKDGDRDRWFTAQEAKEYGFVDHVLSAGITSNN
jgi:ATP-dependent Clp protease, protease subunit